MNEAKFAHEKRRQSDTQPDLQRHQFSGTYHNNLYGHLIIGSTGDRFKLRFGPRHVAKLEHWQNNTFRAIFSNPMLESWHVTFSVSDRSNVESLHAVAAPWAPWYEDSIDPGVFQRTAHHNKSITLP